MVVERRLADARLLRERQRGKCAHEEETARAGEGEGTSSWWRLPSQPMPASKLAPPDFGHAQAGEGEGDQDMTRRTVPFLLIGTMLLVAGCAGRDFVRPRPDALMLGKTSYEDVLTAIGGSLPEGLVSEAGAEMRLPALPTPMRAPGRRVDGET